MSDLMGSLGGGTWPVLAAVALAVVLSAFVPREERLRLRTVVVFAALHAVARLAAAMLPDERPAREMLLVFAWAMTALALTRLAFVVLVDLVVVRLGRGQVNQLVRDVLQAGSYLVVLAVAITASGVSLGSLVAPGALVTAVLGLSMQDTLGNLAAGVSIQLERPIEIGDWIHLDKGDVVGRVVQANWRAVTVENDDRAHLVIPNGIFAKTAFVNHSRPGGASRRTLHFVVPYDVPPARVHEALLAACKDSPYVLATPAPSVLTWTFEERGVKYWMRFFVADFADRDRAQGDVGTRVWYHLHRAKIASAVPVAHQYLHRRDEAAKARVEQEILDDRRAAVDAVDFLRILPEPAKERLARQGHRKLFAPNETILHQGATDRAFYVVRRGRVAVRSAGADVTELGPGEFFGELALLTGRARGADVVARDETEVFEIDEVMFQEVLRLEPNLAERIARVVGEREADLQARRAGGDRPTLQAVTSVSGQILDRVKELFGLS